LFREGSCWDQHIAITPSNGFSGSVSLSATGMPERGDGGVRHEIPPPPQALTLTANGKATTGTATVTVTGTSW